MITEKDFPDFHEIDAHSGRKIKEVESIHEKNM